MLCQEIQFWPKIFTMKQQSKKSFSPLSTVKILNSGLNAVIHPGNFENCENFVRFAISQVLLVCHVFCSFSISSSSCQRRVRKWNLKTHIRHTGNSTGLFSLNTGTPLILEVYNLKIWFKEWVRISSTFSVLCPFAYLRLCLYFNPPTLLRPKLYFDLCFSTNKKSIFHKRSKYRGRSRAVEVQNRSKIWKWSKYRKVELMRTQKIDVKKTKTKMGKNGTKKIVVKNTVFCTIFEEKISFGVQNPASQYLLSAIVLKQMDL